VANSVKETDVVALEANDPDNRSGNAFSVIPMLLGSEKSAARDLSPISNRCWEIVNPNVRSTLGHFAGYTLIPSDNAAPFLQPSTSLRKLAGFIDHPLHVTRYKPDELYAAGDYPSQSKGGAGLPNFVADDESVAN